MSAGDMKTEAYSQIVCAINQILAHRSPVLVALDGGSGSGKSTIASMLAQELDGVIVPLDDFYAANIPDWEWDARSTSARLRDVFDWGKLRREALAPLLAQRTARWYPFDFASGMRPDGTYAISPHPVERQPAPVILLEGAYSASPQIADLIDLKVLLDVPVQERHQRLEKRERDQLFLKRWHALWDDVEAYYFTEVMPKSAFDIVLPG
ncbi:MAG: uridine kinase [Anaerolineales bacterium]